MEPARHRADIDRDDVAVAQPAIARNAMHDLFIDRGADVRRKPVIAEERGHGARLRQRVPRDVVEVGGRHAGAIAARSGRG